MNKEEKRAIKDMDRFANSIDMSSVTAEQMQIILDLIKRLQKENETLKNFVSGIVNEKIEKEFIPVQKIKDKIEKYKNMCISSVDGYENYFKDNYNELVFRRMEQLEKELLESEE